MKAKTLRNIRELCRPRPLRIDELNFFVETTEARDPRRNSREQLKTELKENKDVRMLFCGHRGCGKSTELNQMISELGDQFLVVNFSVLDEMNYISARADDLMLVIAERVLHKAEEKGIKLNPKLLNPVIKYFSETTVMNETTKEKLAGVKSKISAKTNVPFLIKLLAEVKGEIKFDVKSTESSVSTLRKRPADLLANTNTIIESVRNGLENENKKLLIVVEDLDKLDLKQAREIYVENIHLLTGIQANIIYSISVFLFHSPDASAFKPCFDKIVSLPTIKIAEPNGERVLGFNVVKEIILKRVDEEIIESEALDLLIEKTGGVLRHVFQVLATVADMSSAEIPLNTEHIQYGLSQLKKDFWNQVTLPYDPIPNGPKTVDELYDRLAEYARNQLKDQKTKPKSDSINQLLLKSCALVEYNGDGWLGVHPLVIENLEDLGKI